MSAVEVTSRPRNGDSSPNLPGRWNGIAQADNCYLEKSLTTKRASGYHLCNSVKRPRRSRVEICIGDVQGDQD